MEQILPVLLGSDANVYGMARSFYMEYGVTSLAIGKGALAATANSKLVKMAVVEPDLENDAVFVKTLQDFAAAHTGRTLVLVSCGDNYTGLMARNRSALEGLYKFACPTPELVEQLDTKEYFYQACEAHGLAYPRPSAAPTRTGRPWSCPSSSPASSRPATAWPTGTAASPTKRRSSWPTTGRSTRPCTAIYSSSYQDNLVLQEYIPGDDNCMRVLNCYSGKDHKVHLMALGRPLLEEQTPEGIGNYAAILSIGRGADGPDEGLPGGRGLGGLLQLRHEVRFPRRPVQAVRDEPPSGPVQLLCDRQRLQSGQVAGGGRGGGPTPGPDHRRHPSFVDDPAGIIKKYLKDRELLAEVRRLMKEGKATHQLFCKEDFTLKRAIWYAKNQLNNYRKYKRYFGNKSLRD